VRIRLGAAVVAAALAAAAPGGADARVAVAGPSRAAGATIAQIVAPTHARARPGRGPALARLGTRTTWSGHEQRLLVLRSAWRGEREWLKVLLPVRPNGSAGWIPRDKALLGTARYWIDLRLGSRWLTVYRDGRRVRRFRAVVGAPATPTPRGLAAVYERNAQPDRHGFLGPWALSLTAFSNVLESYGGGPGRVAIHGRDGASLRDPLGSARSHGCIRITSRAVSWLARRVTPGTPVRIRR
jgi:lipoprotein-anchoring transpeptidase ErfK/SrfK